MVDNIFVSKYASSKQASKQTSDNIVVFSEGVMLSVYRRAYIKATHFAFFNSTRGQNRMNRQIAIPRKLISKSESPSHAYGFNRVVERGAEVSA